MIVIDASSVSKLLLKEEGWKSVASYLDQNLCATDFVLIEAANAIWKHKHKKGFTSGEARVAFEKLEEIGKDIVLLEPVESYLEEGLNIALKEDMPIYDAIYLAQARKYGTLLTSDGPQGKMAGGYGIRVICVLGGTATKS